MPSLLRISGAASLALHAMAELVRSPGDFLSTREIARELGVSENHLAKVCRQLTRAGLVEAARGPKGGFRLGKRPNEITLLDVYESIEGPLNPDECLLGRQACGSDKCILGDLVESVNRQAREYLSETTLADLADSGCDETDGEASGERYCKQEDMAK